MAVPNETPADRLRLTFELLDLAERMLCHRLRRDHPELSDEAIEARVVAWYQDRPGARHGDAEGTAGTWPRR